MRRNKRGREGKSGRKKARLKDYDYDVSAAPDSLVICKDGNLSFYCILICTNKSLAGFPANMTLKDGYGFGGFSGTPPSEPNMSTPPPPPPPPPGWKALIFSASETSTPLSLATNTSTISSSPRTTAVWRGFMSSAFNVNVAPWLRRRLTMLA